jgi:hypothetical protein
LVVVFRQPWQEPKRSNTKIKLLHTFFSVN